MVRRSANTVTQHTAMLAVLSEMESATPGLDDQQQAISPAARIEAEKIHANTWDQPLPSSTSRRVILFAHGPWPYWACLARIEFGQHRQHSPLVKLGANLGAIALHCRAHVQRERLAALLGISALLQAGP